MFRRYVPCGHLLTFKSIDNTDFLRTERAESTTFVFHYEYLHNLRMLETNAKANSIFGEFLSSHHFCNSEILFPDYPVRAGCSIYLSWTDRNKVNQRTLALVPSVHAGNAGLRLQPHVLEAEPSQKHPKAGASERVDSDKHFCNTEILLLLRC